MKYSYEGEGPELGKKTLFLDYDNESLPRFKNIKSGVTNIYINTSKVDQTLNFWSYSWMSEKDYKVTIESTEKLLIDKQNRRFIYFYTGNDYENLGFLDKSKDYIKIRIFSTNYLERYIPIANKLSSQGFNILLMPEYKYLEQHDIMMNHFDKIEKNVRYMPPVQDILGIK